MFIKSLAEGVNSFLCNLNKQKYLLPSNPLSSNRGWYRTANSLDFSPKDAIHLVYRRKDVLFAKCLHFGWRI